MSYPTLGTDYQGGFWGELRAEWPKAWERMLDVAIRRCWAGIGDQQISDERHYTLNTTKITAN